MVLLVWVGAEQHVVSPVSQVPRAAQGTIVNRVWVQVIAKILLTLELTDDIHEPDN